MTENIANKFAKFWQQRREEIIARAITRRLGRPDWTPEEVAGMGKFVRCQGERWETLIINGKPMAIIHDPEFL